MEAFDTQYRVIIAGHSYVKNLNNFILTDEVDDMGRINTSFGMYKEEISVSFHPLPGARLFQLQCETHKLLKLKPDIAILIVGGNDLDRGQANPTELAAQIYRYGEYLISRGIKFVGLMPIVERVTKTDNFKELADQYNSRMEAMCSKHPNISFRSLKRIGIKELRNDGVHLNNRGNYFLYNAVKSCIRHAISHIVEKSPCVHDSAITQLRGGKRYRVR